MTRELSRSSQGASSDPGRDADLLHASLWQQAPFARLPHDAPAELKDLVQDIENPKRVYSIHRASRRHDFQLLVSRFATQLRQGCGSDSCTTSSCFTCRKRLAGKAPIRRYNTASARTLAVYLASQDNPEEALCPHVHFTGQVPAAVNSLVFTPKHSGQHLSGPNGRRQGANVPGAPARTKPSSSPDPVANDENGGRSQEKEDKDEKRTIPGKLRAEKSHYSLETGQPDVKITERPSSKDHRSFTANLFGTVAFKMVEWLSPASLAAISQKMSSLDIDQETNQDQPDNSAPLITPTSEESHTLPATQARPDTTTSSTEITETTRPNVPSDEDNRERKTSTSSLPPNGAPEKLRRKSSARVRATSAATPKRKVTVEPIAPTPYNEDSAPSVTSPRLSGSLNDRVSWPPKSTPAKSRTIPDIPPTPPFFDNVPPRHHDVDLVEKPGSKIFNEAKRKPSREQPTAETTAAPVSVEKAQRTPATERSEVAMLDEETVPDGVLPQTLKTLNIELIELISDILQDDGTLESHLFEPATVKRADVGVTDRTQPSMARIRQAQSPYPRRLKEEWKLFIQQSLFHILSDPKKLVAAFAKDGKLLDSHSLWYCMLRLTRVAPTLVFDSLWIAAGSLFGAPKQLQSRRSPAGKVFPGPERPLRGAEAGQIMAICLHALIAAAPLVSDSRALWEMSKIRSNGLTLTGGGSIARQPIWLCLQYEDAFSDPLVLRLAKRLFSAMSARQLFAEMVSLNSDARLKNQDLGGLQPLLAQLDLLSIDTTPSLEFSAAERSVHETRASTLLLDWAKTILLHEWDGQPDISCTGSFGGALTLITAMYEKRQSLLLGEAQFRVDYFAERLDAINTPVAWLSFKPSRQKKHLLGFPYILSPTTLVSYFRSINFLRMSRSYEESSSLQTRMKAIVAPGGLITSTHHKLVLQDLLRKAASRFLILEISRENVSRDAFDQLWQREERELLRPLKVHLGESGGEEGFDSGGVQQEFFRLAIAECLNPDFGAFTVDDRTRMAWFVPGSMVPEWKFEIVGLLLSLAVYNGLTLPITFPKALYRKLLGDQVNELHHIADGWPDLASGLTTLLEWDENEGAVEDIFARTYEFSVSMFGQPISREMNSDNPSWPQLSSASDESLAASNPEDAPLVTDENRNAYVSDYIRYLTDVSVRPQFEALARGFRACLHPKSLSLLSPTLLQSLVEGQQEIDISELRRYTRYVGWDASHRTVRDFWAIVKRYDDNMKRKLLEFVTASDRVPVGGMRNLQFVVQKNGEEEGDAGHLPTAYTCYGTLLLPEYRDRDVLRGRMAMALENSQGFGFA